MVVDGKQKALLPFPASLSPRRRPTRWLAYLILACLGFWVFANRGSLRGTANKSNKNDLWHWKNVEEIYAFGDSWSATDFDPNGLQPRDENPMGNPEFPYDHNKKPPDWIQYMTGIYNQSSLKTYNLARGAATIDRDIVLPLFPSTWCFDEQVNDQYNHRYSTSSPSTSTSNRLHIILFGLVDLSLLTREGPLPSKLLTALADRYEEVLDHLFDLGARHFLLLNIPPIDRAPDPQNPEHLRSAILKFNDRLLDIKERLEFAYGKNDEFRIKLFDLHKLLGGLMDDPGGMEQTRGVKNTTENCWGYNPDVFIDEKAQPWDYLDKKECWIKRDEYFWANTLHVTHPVQEAIAARVVEDCFDTVAEARWPGEVSEDDGDKEKTKDGKKSLQEKFKKKVKGGKKVKKKVRKTWARGSSSNIRGSPKLCS